MTPADVSELVAMLSAAFLRPPMTERTMQVYERMLLDLDRDTAGKAVARLIATSKFLPTIAEIRAAAVELQLGPRRLGGEAWGDVGMAVRMFGRYQSPQFSDPLVTECVRQMGWLSLCDSTNDIADRARFIELYNGLAIRQRSDEVSGTGLTLPPAHPVATLMPRFESWIPAQPTQLQEARKNALVGLALIESEMAKSRENV